MIVLVYVLGFPMHLLRAIKVLLQYSCVFSKDLPIENQVYFYLQTMITLRLMCMAICNAFANVHAYLLLFNKDLGIEIHIVCICNIFEH